MDRACLVLATSRRGCAPGLARGELGQRQGIPQSLHQLCRVLCRPDLFKARRMHGEGRQPLLKQSLLPCRSYAADPGGPDSSTRPAIHAWTVSTIGTSARMAPLRPGHVGTLTDSCRSPKSLAAPRGPPAYISLAASSSGRSTTALQRGHSELRGRCRPTRSIARDGEDCRPTQSIARNGEDTVVLLSP